MTFEHLPSVLDEVEELGRRFSDAGYRLYLVGGIVRDQWLGEPLDGSSDIDLTTDAAPAEIKRLVTSFAEDLWTQGEKFGTIGLRAGGRDYEITTHRAESYAEDSRKPVVSFGDNIDVDLSRRDFTVNAMAIELPDGDLVDPYGGAADLSAQVLRTPLSAEISFTDDPLRMLRAARFGAKYSLTPTEELAASASQLRERLRIVAIERIGVEIRRLLGLPASPAGVHFLVETGLLSEVLSYGQPQMVADVQARLEPLPGLVTDLPRDWHIALAGIGLSVFETPPAVQAMCQRLRLSRDDERRIVGLASAAADIRDGATPDPQTLRRWLVAHGPAHDAITLARELVDTPGNVAGFESALHALMDGEDTEQVVLLDGSTIMATINMPPGPAIGQAHAFLQELYYEHGPLAADEQISRLRTWWADRETNS